MGAGWGRCSGSVRQKLKILIWNGRHVSTLTPEAEQGEAGANPALSRNCDA